VPFAPNVIRLLASHSETRSLSHKVPSDEAPAASLRLALTAASESPNARTTGIQVQVGLAAAAVAAPSLRVTRRLLKAGTGLPTEDGLGLVGLGVAALSGPVEVLVRVLSAA
jgi:hypothetical protein